MIVVGMVTEAANVRQEVFTSSAFSCATEQVPGLPRETSFNKVRWDVGAAFNPSPGRQR